MCFKTKEKFVKVWDPGLILVPLLSANSEIFPMSLWRRVRISFSIRTFPSPCPFECQQNHHRNYVSSQYHQIIRDKYQENHY